MYFEFYPTGEGSGHDIQSDNWPDAISECQYYNRVLGIRWTGLIALSNKGGIVGFVQVVRFDPAA